MVIIYGNIYLLSADRLIIWVVELCYIGMFQSLLSSESLAWVELEQISQQVQGIITSSWEHISQLLGLRDVQGLQHGLGQGTVDGLNVLLGWSACHLHHSVQLIQGGSSGEDWLAQQQLGKNTAQTPHIYSLGVLARSKQDFGGSVPPCSYVICQKRLLVRIFSIE